MAARLVRLVRLVRLDGAGRQAGRPAGRAAARHLVNGHLDEGHHLVAFSLS